MSAKPSAPVTVFWSWQSDLPPETTRSLIQGCLERAGKKAGQAGVGVVAVDRDTKGVGGSPNISETILAKIVAADVFVWDASITTTTDRPSPNPNVLFELGFAVAALGWNRIIGVMNTAHGRPEALPFDLRHRRWPIQYDLMARPEEASGTEWPERKAVREALVSALTDAIAAAMATPPENLLRADPDLLLAKRLWKAVDSRWMLGWLEEREAYSIVEKERNFRVLDDYIYHAKRPEMVFAYPVLRERHEAFVAALNRYLDALGVEVVLMDDGEYMLSVKERGRLPEAEYHKEYQRQLDVVYAGLDSIRAAWAGYVHALRDRYPELLHAEADASGSVETEANASAGVDAGAKVGASESPSFDTDDLDMF